MKEKSILCIGGPLDGTRQIMCEGSRYVVTFAQTGATMLSSADEPMYKKSTYWLKTFGKEQLLIDETISVNEAIDRLIKKVRGKKVKRI